MNLLTNPQNYDICFGIASLAVLMVTLIIHMSEEYYYGKQSTIFGALIINGFIMNSMGLIHNIWLESEVFRNIISFDANSLVMVLERVCIYMMSYFSMLYLMALFHIEPDSIYRKLIILVPTLYSIIGICSGLITDFYFTFSDEGKINYHYPQGGTLNIATILYFIFGAYLIIKYASTVSTEKKLTVLIYYFLMLAAIPLRIFTKSSSIFEFSCSIVLLLCVYTFQNPSEFVDRLSGAGTKNALGFSISTNLIQKKNFTLLTIYIERLAVIVGSEHMEAASDLLKQLTGFFKQLVNGGNVFYSDDGYYTLLIPDVSVDDVVVTKIVEQTRLRFKDYWTIKNEKIKLTQNPCAISFPEEVNSLDRYNEISIVMKKALLRQNRDLLRISDLNFKYVEHDKKIDNIVKHALENGLLEVYYQPIYSPDTGKFSSCEALVRLKDPQLGFISPAVFMPVSERNGSVLAIDRFVLDSVCDMIANSGAMDLGLDYVEVNLSIVDCIQINLAESILKTLGKYNVDTSRINFEFTETWDKDISSVMDDNIRKLTAAGCRFSIDDFGTGYSNLTRISTLPASIFKLDKSIVQSAFESETSYMVMYNMIKIIKSLGKEIVAEGVETGEQAKQIIKLGCDHIQGFFYARPMPKDRFIEFLEDNNT